MHRILISLTALVLCNLNNQSCFATQVAMQPKNIFFDTDSTPVYAGEKIVYVEAGRYYPPEETVLLLFRDPEIYTPEFMKIFLKDSQLKDQCRTMFIESNWQGFEPKRIEEITYYFDTVLKNGGVVFLVNFNRYHQGIAQSLHHIYNRLLEKFPRQIQFFEEENFFGCIENQIFSWWKNNPWKTSEILLGRQEAFNKIVAPFIPNTCSEVVSQPISDILKKTLVDAYENEFPAKLHSTISLEQFISYPLPFTLVSFVKQDPIPTITFRLNKKDSHYIVEPQFSSKPFDMLDPEQLKQLRDLISKNQKSHMEKEEKTSAQKVSNTIPLKTFEQAFTYENEKIVYLGIGSYGEYAQSYPEFMQSLCQKSRYKDRCKLILVDGAWKSLDKQEFSKIFSQGLPSTSFFVGDYFNTQSLKKAAAYLETVLENGGVVCIADFTCNWNPDFTIALRNMYNELLKKFPKQINFFEYEISWNLLGSRDTVVWWQDNTWNERASEIFQIRLQVSDSFFPKVSKQHKKATIKAFKRKLAHAYDIKLPARFHATTTLEQFMHEKLPCVFVSLAKTDLLPVLTFSIKKTGSRYTLEPQLSREPLDMFDLKQLDALYKDTLAREKQQEEMKAISASVLTTVEPYPTTIPRIESVQEEKKKAESSCVIA